MSQTSDRPPMPKSMRHKRVLDVAADKPDASLEEIAAEIPSATGEYVERILDQYGDPADALDGKNETDDTSENAGESANNPVAETEPVDELDVNDETEENLLENDESAIEVTEDPIDVSGQSVAADSEFSDHDELTEKQLNVLQRIAEHPKATQKELAEMLDVSAPTISNRVNDIDGFDWKRRAELVSTVLLTENQDTQQETTNMDSTTPDQQIPDEQLIERLTALEEQISTILPPSESDGVFGNPDLAHKVIHACMQSESISEEEELELLRAIMQ